MSQAKVEERGGKVTITTTARGHRITARLEVELARGGADLSTDEVATRIANAVLDELLPP